MRQAGYMVAYPFHDTLEAAGVCTYRPTKLVRTFQKNQLIRIDGDFCFIEEYIVKFEPWVPRWAYMMARDNKGKFRSARKRVELISTIASSPFAEELAAMGKEAILEIIGDLC